MVGTLFDSVNERHVSSWKSGDLTQSDSNVLR
jgi:hypothetical protein